MKKHLLPFFHAIWVSGTPIALVDEYRSEKVTERERITAAAEVGRPIRDKRGQRRVALSNEPINKTLVLVTNILDTAVEHEQGHGPKPALDERPAQIQVSPFTRSSSPASPTSSAATIWPLPALVSLTPVGTNTLPA